MRLYITIRIKFPPYFFAEIYNENHPIPIIICTFLKNITLLFFGAILSHKTKGIQSYVNKNLFKISTKPAQTLIKHNIQFQFE